MKDTELRKHLGFDGYGSSIKNRIVQLERLEVKYCKKCKHDTLQEARRHDTDKTEMTMGWHGAVAVPLIIDVNYCLTCGTLWHCENKTVCKEVK